MVDAPARSPQIPPFPRCLPHATTSPTPHRGESPQMERWIGLIGIVVILLIGVLFSSNRRAIRPRIVAAAFALQAGLAIIVLWTDWGRAGIAGMSTGVSNLLGYA